MGFLKTHIRRKTANRSSGFEASPNTTRHEESRGSTTDTEHLESSILRESASQPIITSTPVSTDSKILKLRPDEDTDLRFPVAEVRQAALL